MTAGVRQTHPQSEGRSSMCGCTVGRPYGWLFILVASSGLNRCWFFYVYIVSFFIIIIIIIFLSRFGIITTHPQRTRYIFCVIIILLFTYKIIIVSDAILTAPIRHVVLLRERLQVRPDRRHCPENVVTLLMTGRDVSSS